MSRTVAHIYRSPRIPLAPQYAGIEWAETNRWRLWFAEDVDLSRASTRHVLRYRKRAGDRAMKERPDYVRKKIAAHEYGHGGAPWRRSQRTAVMVAEYNSSNRLRDRMSARTAVRLANSQDFDDLTECFKPHWHRHAALWDS